MTEFSTLGGLAVALGIGLLIGLERGWSERDRAEGSRVAGIRTFGLIGLSGGLSGLLGAQSGPWILAGGIVGLAGLLSVSYWRGAGGNGDLGMTTEVAALLTYLLGAAVPYGHAASAVAVAVAIALLLRLKPTLHGWLRRIEEPELLAGLQLLLISVVGLPFLPDRGFGPGEVLNPYRLWWMVVAISGLSFLGYVAARVLGTRGGALLTGLIGGIVSSTAVTMTLCRLARRAPDQAGPLAAGVVAASVMMLARVAVLLAVLAPQLLSVLAAPFAAAGIAGVVAAWLLGRGRPPNGPPDATVRNPLELGMALQFALLLALVLLLTGWLRDQIGDLGVVLAAAIAGVSDVDAPTLSVAALLGRGLAGETATTAIGAALISNSLVKSGLAATLGGRAVALRIAGAFGAMMIAGAAGIVAVL